MPDTVLLLKVMPSGKKLHIPHRDRPLCEVGRYNLTPQPDVDYLQGEGVTCANCLKQANRINEYL